MPVGNANEAPLCLSSSWPSGESLPACGGEDGYSSKPQKKQGKVELHEELGAMPVHTI